MISVGGLDECRVDSLERAELRPRIGVGRPVLPVLVLPVQPGLQPLQLLLGADVEHHFDDDEAAAHQLSLKDLQSLHPLGELVLAVTCGDGGHQHVLVVGTVEDPHMPRGRQPRNDPLQVVLPGLSLGRLPEGGHVDAERVHGTHHRLHHPALAGGVHALQHQQHARAGLQCLQHLLHLGAEELLPPFCLRCVLLRRPGGDRLHHRILLLLRGGSHVGPQQLLQVSQQICAVLHRLAASRLAAAERDATAGWNLSELKRGAVRAGPPQGAGVAVEGRFAGSRARHPGQLHIDSFRAAGRVAHRHRLQTLPARVSASVAR